MRNAGDLAAAGDLYKHFWNDARQSAAKLKLPRATHAFSLPMAELETRYFELFDSLCEELRSA